MCSGKLFDTSETGQEEGGILTFPAECLARIRPANASQTKTVLFCEEEECKNFCSVPRAGSHYTITLFLLNLSLPPPCRTPDSSVEMRHKRLGGSPLMSW